MRAASVNRIVSLIFTVRRAVLEQQRQGSATDPSSIIRAETLRHIAERPHIPMGEIAEHLCITPPSATALINSLVRSGHLTRVRDRNDRRLVRLAITPRGREAIRRTFNRVAAQMRGAFARLTERERRDLIRILEKLSKPYISTK